MFDQLTKHLTESIKHLGGQRRFTEDNMKPVLREVRLALLEADVALPVVKTFAENIKEKATYERRARLQYMAFPTTHWRRARHWPHEKVQNICRYSPQ